ncbi:hypothetical protein GE061_012390 [Apolygus lucorum]|uniref:2Fe-2S ferredoxin-type domain-containing protein n=1 Tax=Apolygus lucorum TaxID=248454 RepID=A0A8S9XTE4_APOLU|nr:hypothetical protein GE061_012390 [Apolygus lucorum]
MALRTLCYIGRAIESTKIGLHTVQTGARSLSTSIRVLNKPEYSVTFVRPDGEKIKAKGKEGDTLLDVVVNHDLDIDGYGACEGTLTCSTCHVILKPDDFAKLPDKPSEEENDMLDLAYGLTDTSRLGCQIQLSKQLDGLEVQLPATINDARS